MKTNRWIGSSRTAKGAFTQPCLDISGVAAWIPPCAVSAFKPCSSVAPSGPLLATSLIRSQKISRRNPKSRCGKFLRNKHGRAHAEIHSAIFLSVYQRVDGHCTDGHRPTQGRG